MSGSQWIPGTTGMKNSQQPLPVMHKKLKVYQEFLKERPETTTQTFTSEHLFAALHVCILHFPLHPTLTGPITAVDFLLICLASWIIRCIAGTWRRTLRVVGLRARHTRTPTHARTVQTHISSTYIKILCTHTGSIEATAFLCSTSGTIIDAHTKHLHTHTHLVHVDHAGRLPSPREAWL